MRYDVECPYCDHGQDVCHDDGYGYEEDTPHQMECGECEKTFIFRTAISYDYETEEAPCLNGGEHVWRNPVHVPTHFKVAPRHCNDCEVVSHVPNPRYKESSK